MAGQNITKKEVTLYYADWCGHCKTFKPEWFGFKGAYQQLKDEIEKKYHIVLVLNEYENDTDPTDAAGNAGVRGFPTVKIQYNEKIDDYIGDRTAKGLFEKTINASPSDIESWVTVADEYKKKYLEKQGSSQSMPLPLIQMGGMKGIRNYGINVTDPRIVFANSYRKMEKYRQKCLDLEKN